MEISETVKLPMKYIERCCVGGKISNGFDSFFRNWRNSNNIQPSSVME